MTPSQSIRDGESLVSAGGTFEVGFFSPGNSKSRYLGIWYRVSPMTVVWVANRDKPLNNTSGVLEVNDQGVLLLQNGSGSSSNSTVWSSNVTKQADNINPIVQLLDSGNLLVREGSDILWQSFDYPCDTLLPGMELGWNLETGHDRFLSSWKNGDDPDLGDYVFKIDYRGYPQAVELKGTAIMNRAGPWNGLTFSANPIQTRTPQYDSDFVVNQKEIFFKSQLLDKSALFRYILTPSGNRQIFHWKSETSSWELMWSQPSVQCDNYALCGANSICNSINNPQCACLKGFVSKYPAEWNVSNWSDGCVRITPLSCGKDGFRKYTGMILPDTSSSWFNKTMVLQECEDLCLQNCSCTAYANMDISGGGSGCLLWFHDLIDMRQFPQAQGGQDIYIRFPLSELQDHYQDELGKKLASIISACTVFIVCIILGLTICVWKKKLAKPGMRNLFYQIHHNYKLRRLEVDPPAFDLPLIVKATNNFSGTNKLGEGGFGSVYKGTLMNGQDIAVKRLSKNSDQGLEEFKNEVSLIAKLQHRNLVNLLGYCIQGGEKIGYMPPEYVVHGHFSMKSDVFSFGVIVLEIISGKKINGFIDHEHFVNLVGHAWRLWTEGRPMKLIDTFLGERCTPSEVIRCIHVGLLCVQRKPEDRPDMSAVVLMLNGEKLLPQPKAPSFYTGRDVEADSLSEKLKLFTKNDISLTILEAR
ncbi:putative serine/threonine-protein kinase [Sesbania bispinosa]|nr:putative serine/threonine-protein kinase [Sesbania bispinosa]